MSWIGKISNFFGAERRPLTSQPIKFSRADLPSVLGPAPKKDKYSKLLIKCARSPLGSQSEVPKLSSRGLSKKDLPRYL